MKFNIKSISDLIEKESFFFQELLNEYQFYIKIGNSPDGKWFEKLLQRREIHIDRLKFIFNNDLYKNIFENEIPQLIKQNFQKIISEILAIDSQMKEVISDLQNKKSEQLVKIKKVNKLLALKTENNRKAKVINIAVR
ncbi:MAG: hypothetical protein H8E60_08860 [Candidatus Marinimicrobia bacterium]|nr:hypothetical protein [Candidatus Neomarinimicrobiota bacterium]